MAKDLLEVIKDNYKAAQVKTLVKTLKELSIYETVDESVRLFYNDCNRNNVQIRRTQFSLFVTCIMIITTHWYRAKLSQQVREKNAGLVFHLAATLMADAKMHKNLSDKMYCGVMKEIQNNETQNIDWKQFSFHFIMGFTWAMTCVVTKNGNIIVKSTGGIRNTYLLWHKWPDDKIKKINRNLFICDLMELLKGLDTKSTLTKLFKDTNKDYKIKIWRDHLEIFLIIFKRLYACKRISCKNKKGLFVLLRAHFEFLDGVAGPKRKEYYRLVDYKLDDNSYPSEFSEALISLLNKYCTM
jgi:hypothetical protein